MEGLLDRADGGLRGGVGSGEGAERDAEGVGVCGDHLAVLDARGDEAHGDMGVGAVVGVVAPGDGEVEAVAVKCLAVDLDWSCCKHINIFY